MSNGLIMKYEESKVIEDNGQYKEVIHLHDLQQSLVVDHNENPYEIKLLDMQSDEVLATFKYGYNEEHEGFSFTVSPRHNYLIVKEVQYGQSMDNLYATLYCLKDKKAVRPSKLTTLDSLHSPYFHSFTHLTFLFSADMDENTMWVHGRKIDNLDVIDVYEYGDSEPDENGSNALHAKFYKTASYPMVALDSAFNEGSIGLQSGLTADTVVNNFADLKRKEFKAVCAFDLHPFSGAIPEILVKSDGAENIYLSHSMLGSITLKSNTTAFKEELKKLTLSFSGVLDEKSYLEYISISLPLAPNAEYIKQSIAHLSRLCSEYGVIYQGFFIGKNKVVNTWQQALNESFLLSQALAEYLDKNLLSMSAYTELFYKLMRKHQAVDLMPHFTELQQQSFTDIDTALSQFDDWDIQEEELRQTIRRCLE